ncbi:hypothetical protein [Alloalcanivorax marinus]|uniref:hypothetical protein n=1 Tax=Alloalcanivorax marinus TaxID=1177169 RepID=UPI001934A4C6|nr:hypothetical protein [Alloalcanivorax marinus]MBL7252009.1 hypothetical protein [Alloalcanivorax marinus]
MSTTKIQEGDTLPGREFKADTVQLFLYNAAIWNPHRIHYDLPYTREQEGHPGLLIDGPLQGDWLTQIIEEWLGDRGVLTAFRYSNRQAAYIGEVLAGEGHVTDRDGDSVTLSLALRNQEGATTTVATASVRVDPGH